MSTRIIEDIVSTLVVAGSLGLLLLTGDRQLEAIGLLLSVVAYRLWIIGSQQRDHTELLALLVEGQDDRP